MSRSWQTTMGVGDNLAKGEKVTRTGKLSQYGSKQYVGGFSPSYSCFHAPHSGQRPRWSDDQLINNNFWVVAFRHLIAPPIVGQGLKVPLLVATLWLIEPPAQLFWSRWESNNAISLRPSCWKIDKSLVSHSQMSLIFKEDRPNKGFPHNLFTLSI